MYNQYAKDYPNYSASYLQNTGYQKQQRWDQTQHGLMEKHTQPHAESAGIFPVSNHYGHYYDMTPHIYHQYAPSAQMQTLYSNEPMQQQQICADEVPTVCYTNCRVGESNIADSIGSFVNQGKA